jgi:hypothetical protein
MNGVRRVGLSSESGSTDSLSNPIRGDAGTDANAGLSAGGRLRVRHPFFHVELRTCAHP